MQEEFHFYLFPRGDVPRNMDAADQGAGIIMQRRNRDKEVPAKVILMDLSRMLLPVFQEHFMGAVCGGKVRRVDDLVASPPDGLFRDYTEAFRHCFVDAEDPVVLPDDCNQVSYPVEGVHPLLFCPDQRHLLYADFL